MKKLYEKYPNFTVLFIIIIIVFIYRGYRSYHTKILPFQNLTLNCTMVGKQLYTYKKGEKFQPVVILPSVFKIKFGFFDGEFIEGGDVLIKNHFLNKKIFGYQYKENWLLIQPSYNPPWLKEGEASGNTMYFYFPLSFKNSRDRLLIEYFSLSLDAPLGEYDATYKCEKTK